MKAVETLQLLALLFLFAGHGTRLSMPQHLGEKYLSSAFSFTQVLYTLDSHVVFALRDITMWTSLILIGLFVGQVVSQSKPFPFGPRRRVLPGQRSSGCSDCAAELKQCILTCVEKFDCSEMNIKEGFCPIGDKKSENCSISSVSFLNVCKTDTDCPGTKKCCHSGCSKVCASALPVPPQTVARRSRTQMKLG